MKKYDNFFRIGVVVVIVFQTKLIITSQFKKLRSTQLRAGIHTTSLQPLCSLLHTLLPWHNIMLSAEDCFALISALPLHHCDKGQSPNTMAASSWWPDSRPSHVPLQLIRHLTSLKTSKQKTSSESLLLSSVITRSTQTIKKIQTWFIMSLTNACCTHLQYNTAFIHVINELCDLLAQLCGLLVFKYFTPPCVLASGPEEQENRKCVIYHVLYPKLISGLSLWSFSHTTSNWIIYGGTISQSTIPLPKAICVHGVGLFYTRNKEQKQHAAKNVIIIFNVPRQSLEGHSMCQTNIQHGKSLRKWQ